jgi:hypothetical protein
MKQELLWIPIGRDLGGESLVCDPVPYAGKKPSKVWTLFMEEDPDKKPELPYHPAHLQNAFIEDWLHDWDLVGGMFKYYSRVSEGGVWLLLEFYVK